MKLLSYNILAGSRGRLPIIVKIIEEEQPDFVAIQEANGFEKQEGKVLVWLAKKLQLPHFALSPAAKFGFHVASFSRYPIVSVTKYPLSQNACLSTTVKTTFGELMISNVHPCPHTELDRLVEVKKVLTRLSKKSSMILMGDMNSLSPHDGYSKRIVAKLSERQRTKHMLKGKLTTRVISLIEKAGFIDTAVHMRKNNIRTAPTGVDLNEPYTMQFDAPRLRLDYVFVTRDLIPRVVSYAVLRNKTTASASDHFPITINLSKVTPHSQK